MASLTARPRFDVPGPRVAPLVGRIASVARFANDSIGYARQLFQTYGRIVALTAGGGTRLYSPLPGCPGTLLAYGPEMVRQVTSHHEIYFKYPISMGLYPQGEVTPRTAPLKHLGVGLPE